MRPLPLDIESKFGLQKSPLPSSLASKRRTTRSLFDVFVTPWRDEERLAPGNQPVSERRGAGRPKLLTNEDGLHFESVILIHRNQCSRARRVVGVTVPQTRDSLARGNSCTCSPPPSNERKPKRNLLRVGLLQFSQKEREEIRRHLCARSAHAPTQGRESYRAPRRF